MSRLMFPYSLRSHLLGPLQHQPLSELHKCQDITHILLYVLQRLSSTFCMTDYIILLSVVPSLYINLLSGPCNTQNSFFSFLLSRVGPNLAFKLNRAQSATSVMLKCHGQGTNPYSAILAFRNPVTCGIGFECSCESPIMT